jgi:hypothetical protein
MPTAWIKWDPSGEMTLTVTSNEDDQVVRSQKLQGSQDHSFILDQANRLLEDFGGWHFHLPVYWERTEDGYKATVSLRDAYDAHRDMERCLIRRGALAHARVSSIPKVSMLNEHGSPVRNISLMDVTREELRDLADQHLQEAGWLRVTKWDSVGDWSTGLCRSTEHDITMELRWAMRKTPLLVGPDGGWVMSVRVDGELVWTHPFVPGFAGLDCWPRDGFVLAEKLQGAIPYLDGVVVFDEGGEVTDE